MDKFLCVAADERSEVQLRDVLFFATGIKELPPVGFSKIPSLSFLHDDPSRFPKAHTCDCQLLLPTVHGTYAEFVIDMSFAIRNGYGFGVMSSLN